MSTLRDVEAADHDELMRRWRARIAVQRANRLAADAAVSTAVEPIALSEHALRLQQAGALANVGSTLPSLEHLGPVRRAVARVVGTVILYFLRLITLDQQRFNRLLVEMAHTHGARDDDLDVRVSALVDRIDALTAELATLHGALAAQASRRDNAVDHAARQAQYVSLFAGHRDVLDLGCARGEFLALLRDAGIAARGVDRDPAMQRCCSEQGLDVVCNDALDYLESLPDQSLGGIFCGRVLEPLGEPDLLRLIGLAQRRLRRGGILLVETLDPESLRALLVAQGFHQVAMRQVLSPYGPLPASVYYAAIATR